MNSQKPQRLINYILKPDELLEFQSYVRHAVSHCFDVIRRKLGIPTCHRSGIVGREIRNSRIKIGRKVYFRTELIAAMIDQNLPESGVTS